VKQNFFDITARSGGVIIVNSGNSSEFKVKFQKFPIIKKMLSIVSPTQ